MQLVDDRLVFSAGSLARPVSDFDVALVGHAPGQPDVARLLADSVATEAIAGLGLHADLTALRDGSRTHLNNLPIPLTDAAAFRRLFPEAEQTATRYQSRLGGDRAWLGPAVDDFFVAAGALRQRRLWVVVVSEGDVEDGQTEFLPDPHATLLAPESLGAFQRALLIPGLGAMALPDLERLQVPSRLPDVRRVRLPNPEPAFLPCSNEEYDDTHRERRYGDEIPSMPDPWPLARVLPPIVRTLATWRPDVSCLLTLPPAYTEASSGTIAPEAAAWLAHARSDDGSGLHRIQCLFPYLTTRQGTVNSPAGVIAGTMAQVAARSRVWRSVAGRPLATRSRTFPAVDRQGALALRREPGVGVLVHRGDRIELEDERLLTPCVPAAYVGASQAEAYRSGEVARFLGWLRRALERLGERMVFDLDARDPRPRMALERFFGQLHAASALRGRSPEQAFSIRSRLDGESTVIFDIEIAPAFPIDKIFVRVSHHGAAATDGWRVEAATHG